MAERLGLTKELLEKAVGEPIERFESSVGSKAGDGYACSMFKADVWTKKEPTKARHLILKCYPENESRQAVLDHGNIFQIEHTMYDQVIPALNKMVETGEIPIPLPFAPFLYGQFVPQDQRQMLGRPMKPLDNCLIMPDMRQPANGSFRLRELLRGFDLDHQALVMEGQATLHAVSWAYKCRMGLKNVKEAFPKLDGEVAEMWKAFLPIFEGGMNCIGEWMPNLTEPLGNLKKVCHSVAGIYLDYDGGQAEKGHTKDNIVKNPGRVVENEDPWRVLLHGDVWNNNLMFRYDAKTNRPVEVIFVDLQLSRDGDPFSDICASLFMNAEPYLRKKHLTSLLHVYFDRFTQICDSLSVPYLPNWDWEEFNRRFRRASIYGGFMASGIFMNMKNPEAIRDIDEVMSEGDLERGSSSNAEEAMKQIGEIFGAVKKSDIHPSGFARLQSVFEDLVEHGVL